MTSRKQRETIATETVRALDDGFYRLPSGKRVGISAQLESAKRETVLYRPGECPHEGKLDQEEMRRPVIEVVRETTLAAARRLTAENPASDVFALNFASAKNPGGGFLGGSQAQEESLARASGLYACLLTQWNYYEENRACGTCLYTDHMIYSPRVPVFRDDDDELLEEPYPVSFLTAPAVNAGVVRQKEPGKAGQIEHTMLRRMRLLLSVAVAHGHRVIVLGAWGCGVFQNNADEVAGWFRHVLRQEGFAGYFDRITFAIVGNSKNSAISSFEKAFPA